jgi:tetratricopeptide (TPR) repeat protein
MSKEEKRLFAQAKHLLNSGKVQPAAQLLESIGMQREAITALENSGFIHDAAKILMRMQRHNRAGVVYARHAMWDKAAECFKMANMPLEVAKCYREAGNFQSAAEHYEKAEKFEDAADCYLEKGNLHRAAKLYGIADKKDKALELYNQIAQNAGNLASLDLGDSEIKIIMDHLSEGNTDSHLADIIVSKNKLTDIIRHLVGKGMVKQASDLYLRSTHDIGPLLINEISYSDPSAEHLAQVFINVANYGYAGMLFERIASFERAGEAFEKAEDYNRAAYCYERAGLNSKAYDMKDRQGSIKKKSSAGKTTAPNNNGPRFSLTSVTEAPDEQATQMIDSTKFNPDKDHTIKVDPADVGTPPPSQSATKARETSSVHLASLDETEDETADESSDALAKIKIDDARALFHQSQAFSELDYVQRNTLWDLGVTQMYEPGNVILDYDQLPSGLYVILSGQVQANRKNGLQEYNLDTMKEPDSFGELWLIAELPTSVQFVALSSCRIHMIDRSQFKDLLDKDATLARKLYKRFTQILLNRLVTSQDYWRNLRAS